MSPNLFIVGTPKAGTTSIHDNLASVNGIYMSRVKEPHYFSDIGRNVPSVEPLGENEYYALFEDVTSEVIIGESSVSYLHDPAAPNKIKESCPNSKIVVMLRNPVHRLYSHWLMDFREGVTSLPFKHAVDKDYESTDKGFGTSHMYIECSMYAEAVMRYVNIFGRDRVFVGFFEDYVEDGDAFMRRLVEWLESPTTWDGHQLSKSNPAGEVRNRLIAIFFHNFYLRKLLKKHFSEKFKSRIRNLILKPAKKSKIEKEDFDYYFSYFQEDISKLGQVVEWDYKRWGYER